MPLTAKQLKDLRMSPATKNRLRAARLALGLTQVQMSESIGISQQALSDLETSRYPSTTVDTAGKFSEFFGCLIEDLFPQAVSRAS